MEFIFAFITFCFIIALMITTGWVIAQSQASAALDETLARRS